MRNLQLRKRFVSGDDSSIQPLTGCTWDENSVVYSRGPSKENPLLELRRWTPEKSSQDAAELITSFDASCPLPDLECDRVLSLYFLPEKSAICLVLAGGDLVLVREDPLPGEEKIEIVGSVEVGLTAAEWSPDGELLMLATRADTVLLMTRELENSTSTTFAEDDLQASKHVSVGWGKKETQFTGRGVRALRDPTMPEKVDEGVRSAFDDDSTTVSWRGDGQFFAVNSRQASNRRVIRVYSRECELDGVTEPVDNLEAALSWRPAGNLIAGIQRHADRIDVVFFERNGLRHGEFSLRSVKGLPDGPDPASSIRLQWNYDSSVLAICLADRVQLWTMGNYHYYLKQEIMTHLSAQSTPTTLDWDSGHPLRFIVNRGDRAELWQYASNMARSPTNVAQTGTVAVIDGRTIKVTSLRYANIPPPMSQAEIAVNESVLDVAAAPDDNLELICILDLHNIYLYDWKPQEKSHAVPQLRLSTALGEEGEVLSNWKVRISAEGLITVTSGTSNDAISRTFAFKKDPYQWQEQDIMEGAEFSHQLIGKRDFDQTEVATIPSLLDDDPKTPQAEERAKNEIAFGLTRSGHLYAGEKLLIKDCTSFAVTATHLIYTTSKHLLKFVHLAPVADLDLPPDTPEADERCRAVERGARIVTAIPATAAVILQMPRGNLETIFPRALVLADIRRDIDRKKYKKAFVSCRKQRVDMNIIHDYKPEQFLANIELFVEQVQKVAHIDLFLSQLRDEDVSVSLYKDTLPLHLKTVKETEKESATNAVGKVNRICEAFLPVLRAKADTNLQNVITAHVCKLPPDIDSGLKEVATFQHRGEDDGQRAVEHICFLVDVNRLFDNALGLYDLRLALLIAQRSQKDPKEYMALLRRLNDLPEQRRKFEIDDYLDRHRKALANLWELNDFAEYKKYVAKHDLYEDALSACHYEEPRYLEVMALYADYLQRHARYKDAGIAFEYLRDYASATEAYRLAHLWRESLSSACIASFEQSALNTLATTIAESLVELKDFHSAAVVHKDYLSDIETAARLFCRGNWFADAIRLLSLSGEHAALIPDIVDAGLAESMAGTVELLADCRGQLNAQVPRLRELRVRKAEEPLVFYEGMAGDGGADVPDNISLAPTDASTMGGSLFTRYTGKASGTVGTNATRRTAKNKRREERRRARGKKGTVYEEEYLVNSIGRLMDRISAVVDEVERLVAGLMRRGMRERARAVEEAMRAVVALCADCRDEVFQLDQPQPPQQQQQQNTVGQAVDPQGLANGFEGDLADGFEEGPPKREPPVLPKFESLSLLG